METRKEFYEDVVLWSILSTGQAQRTEKNPTIWQRFLDDVCYLCDTKHGGKFVVSIAVSQWSDRQYFFISANGNLRKAANQLHLVLRELYQIEHKSDVEIEITKERLLDIGVRSSSMKVRNYMRELRSHIRSAELLDIVREGWLSIEPFRALLALESHTELSHRAYHMRYSRAYQDLKMFSLQNPSNTVCRRVRHYLGRLASWAKCSRFVVEMTSKYDLLARLVEVRCVPCPRTTTKSNESTGPKPVEHLVASLIRAGVRDARAKCQSTWQPLVEMYEERWKSIERGPIVHAEMIMLDHFDLCNLPFAHVYMANHPLKLATRTCHNNVWVKWALPRCIQGEKLDSSEGRDDVMDNLSNLIKQSVRETLSRSAMDPYQPMLDSVTDLSASLPTVFHSVRTLHA